jgi:hypothetical protein
MNNDQKNCLIQIINTSLLTLQMQTKFESNTMDLSIFFPASNLVN